ncbi:unnamed protein product [Toxocara canis]|uniref:Uncharacterized protein n=1 Tax=Toxocara canis TaxID=6265 RepID=A0A183UHB2_TOXCA|nr:unnamed protein product [Toxocara canis]
MWGDPPRRVCGVAWVWRAQDRNKMENLPAASMERTMKSMKSQLFKASLPRTIHSPLRCVFVNSVLSSEEEKILPIALLFCSDS